MTGESKLVAEKINIIINTLLNQWLSSAACMYAYFVDLPSTGENEWLQRLGGGRKKAA